MTASKVPKLCRSLFKSHLTLNLCQFLLRFSNVWSWISPIGIYMACSLQKNLNKMKPNCRIPAGSTLLIATWVLFEETSAVLNWVHCLICWHQSEARLTQHNLLTHISNGVSVSECTQVIHRYSGTSRLAWLEKQTHSSGALMVFRKP